MDSGLHILFSTSETKSHKSHGSSIHKDLETAKVLIIFAL